MLDDCSSIFYNECKAILEQIANLRGFDFIDVKPQNLCESLLLLDNDFFNSVANQLYLLLFEETKPIRYYCLIYLISVYTKRKCYYGQFIILFSTFINDNTYVQFKVADVLYTLKDHQKSCIDIFYRIIIDSQNPFFMRYKAAQNLCHLAHKGERSFLLPYLLGILAFEDNFLKEADSSYIEDSNSFFPDILDDSDYPTYTLIDIKESVLYTLIYYRDSNVIMDFLIDFLLFKNQPETLISTASYILSFFSSVKECTILLKKLSCFYSENIGAQMVIGHIIELYGYDAYLDFLKYSKLKVIK